MKRKELLFFQGGIHPNDRKGRTRLKSVNVAPLLEKYTVILGQNIGAPPKLIVKPGDDVKKGQLIAEADGFVSARLHSPTSGTVKRITTCPNAMGIPVPAVEIVADGNDEWGSSLKPIEDWHEASPEELKQRVADAGIVGMGGAAFPTHVKLSPPDGAKIDTLIINGAECEPYLTADHRIMLETPEKVIEGAAILGRIMGVTKIFIGIENNKKNAIKMLRFKARGTGIKIGGLQVQYPQGAEKQLIYSLTGRKVPTGGLPLEVGCMMQNVASTVAIVDAVVRGWPLIDRITTVTGAPVVYPGNWRFKIGTPVAEAIKLCGGVNKVPGKVILGGPMMGFAQKTLDVTLTKNSSGILLLSEKEIEQYGSDPCIHCGRCVRTCPMNLLPSTIGMAVESERFDVAEKLHAAVCIECGACSYACPAHRPLTQHCRRAKAAFAARAAKKKKA